MNAPRIALLALLLFPALIHAQALAASPTDALPTEAPQPKAEEPLAEPTPAALRKLSTGLASESFEIRERSQAALSKYALQYPEVVKSALGKDFLETADPEVKFRLADVIYDAVVDYMEHSGNPHGLLPAKNITAKNAMYPTVS